MPCSRCGIREVVQHRVLAALYSRLHSGGAEADSPGDGFCEITGWYVPGLEGWLEDLPADVATAAPQPIRVHQGTAFPLSDDDPADGRWRRVAR